VNLVFLFNEGRLRRLERARAGEAGSEFFYGAIELERAGHAVRMLEVGAPAGSALGRRLGSILDRLQWLPCKTRSALVAQVAPLSRQIGDADVVIATTSGIAFAAALWQLAGRFAAPIVAIHCGLLNHRHGFMRRRVSGALLGRMWTELFGEGEAAGMGTVFGAPAGRVRVNQFGVDTAFWSPGDAPREDFVLAVGNDGRRDYLALVRAAASIDAPVRIVTRRELPEQLPANVSVVRGGWHEESLSDVELRDLYRRAACVAVPLLDSPQPSGQSVCLQAMACGAPVVLTRTRGLWQGQGLEDGRQLSFVAPGDATALAAAICALLADPARARAQGAAGREFVERNARIEQFAQRLAETCRDAMSGAGHAGAMVAG